MKNKLVQNALLCFALVAASALAACDTNKSTSAPESKNRSVSETKPTEAKNDQAKNDQAKNETASGDSVGVAECDEYIKKYEACLTSKVPEAGRTIMKQSFEQQRNGFKQAASTAEGKKSLVSVCKTAMDSAKQATSAYNCTW